MILRYHSHNFELFPAIRLSSLLKKKGKDIAAMGSKTKCIQNIVALISHPKYQKLTYNSKQYKMKNIKHHYGRFQEYKISLISGKRSLSISRQNKKYNGFQIHIFKEKWVYV
jgi:hypothetical protein